ncbi:MAG: DUF2752 domain-containing protein [bacterium]|uniref:DUF2752 domain-containing protein n=1 Tax=Candidatus Aphodosoma intestinipullorum TaxID=2840674 RepID=A0A940IEQ6_9BACT|nr:DUF2752 domain-containing protein [Candidatus Aphodosoma intestinipullorum]
MTSNRCEWFYAAAAIAVVIVGSVLFLFNPAETGVFPRCPFLMLTGYECPGCGSQRAIHALLHGDIIRAWDYNPLLVIAVPYIILGFIAELSFRRSRLMCTVRDRLYSGRAVWIVLTVIIIYWIGRNVL